MKRNLAGCALFLTLAVTMPLRAHRSIAVFFDHAKQVKVTGTVQSFLAHHYKPEP